jgi:hypothetical protein
MNEVQRFFTYKAAVRSQKKIYLRVGLNQPIQWIHLYAVYP